MTDCLVSIFGIEYRSMSYICEMVKRGDGTQEVVTVRRTDDGKNYCKWLGQRCVVVVGDGLRDGVDCRYSAVGPELRSMRLVSAFSSRIYPDGENI